MIRLIPVLLIALILAGCSRKSTAPNEDERLEATHCGAIQTEPISFNTLSLGTLPQPARRNLFTCL